jgi:hypothetical protein
MNIESKFVCMLVSKLEGYYSIDLNEKNFFSSSSVYEYLWSYGYEIR